MTIVWLLKKELLSSALDEQSLVSAFTSPRHLSVLPVLIRLACSCPSCQRCCAASTACSGKTKGNAAGAASSAQAGRKENAKYSQLPQAHDMPGSYHSHADSRCWHENQMAARSQPSLLVAPVEVGRPRESSPHL